MFQIAFKVMDSRDIELQVPATPLHESQEDTNHNVVEDPDRDSPLFSAVSNGCLDSVQALLQKDTNVDTSNSDGDTVLHVAVREDRPVILKEFLEKATDIGVRNNKKESPICIAVTRKHKQVCEMLCNAGADVSEIVGEDEQSLLHLAISLGHTKIAMMLINKGAKLDTPDKKGNIPLHLAATRNFEDEALVKLLIKKGERELLAKQNAEGNTPLHIAADGGHYATVTLMLDHRSPIDVTNIDGDTVVHRAAHGGYPVTAGMILDKNPHLLNMENKTQHLPIHKAILAGKVKMVKSILDRYSTDDDLWIEFLYKVSNAEPCILHMAIETGQEDLVSVFLQHRHWTTFLMMEHYHVVGLRCTPMRRLITEMPQLAKLVLDKCWQSHNDQLIACFELVDDMYCDWSKQKDTSASSLWSKDNDLPAFPAESRPYTTERSLLKKNHALKMIVDSNNKVLMDHPLTKALLRRKWRLVAAVYFSFLMYYITFTGLMSAHMIMAKPPFGQPPCLNHSTAEFMTSHTFALHVAIYLLAGLGIITEVMQLFLMKTKYFKEFHNLLDWFSYVAPIVVLGTSSTWRELSDWQWQLGVAGLFVSYMNMLFFLRIVPLLGIYVMMVILMLENFIHFFVIMFLFVLSFGICFYLLAQNQVGFSSSVYSVMKSYMMMFGELDFDGIFLDDDTQLHYTMMMWILYIAFLIFMSLVIMNLLTSLAVSGVEALEEDSQYRILSLQINLALDVELAMPSVLHRAFGCVVKFHKFCKPSVRQSCLSVMSFHLEKILFGNLHQKDIIEDAKNILGGDKQDQTEAPKPLTPRDVDNCVYRKTKTIKTQIKEIEKVVDKLTDFVHGIDAKLENICCILQANGKKD